MSRTSKSSPKLRAINDATESDVDDELARRSLIAFTERTKPDYLIGWFHRELAAILDQFVEDVLQKKSPRLIISSPPQFGKSELISRRMPAYLLGRNPDLKIGGTAYSRDLAITFCMDVQRIIDSEVYSRLFPDTRILAQNSTSRIERRSSEEFSVVGKKGSYRGVGRNGVLTGLPVHVLVVDDPLKNFEEAISETIREASWNWFATTADTRMQEGGGVIIVATRWHVDDIIGRIVERQQDKWKIFNFQAIAEQDEKFRKKGEPLSVERFSLETLLSRRDGGILNSYQWNALYQGNPTPPGGRLFKREDWRLYDCDAISDDDFDELFLSWDCTFKETKDSDYVSGQCWGILKTNKYLVDRVNDRMTFKATKTAILTMSSSHPRAKKIFIEDKANGPAIIDDMHDSISGLIAVEPLGGKIARANAVSGEVESHHVFLPARRNLAGKLIPLPWVHAFIEQHAAFPGAAHDDDVDAMSQALSQIRKRRRIFLM